MSELIENLIKLQRLDIRIHALQEFLENLPAARKELEEKRKAAQEDMEKKREELEEAKKELRRKERKLEDGEAKLKEIQVKLNQAKTNKEYEAALKEMDYQKNENSRLEEEIIILYDKVEEAEKEKARLEEEWRQQAGEFDKQEKELEARAAAASSELEKDEKERAELAARLDSGLLEHYETLRKRTGRGVARAEAEVCLGCHHRIPAQNYNLVLKGEEPIKCGNCFRFLVHLEHDLEEGLLEINP